MAMEAERLEELAELARAARIQWLMSSWQDSPAQVTKVDVLQAVVANVDSNSSSSSSPLKAAHARPVVHRRSPRDVPQWDRLRSLSAEIMDLLRAIEDTAAASSDVGGQSQQVEPRKELSSVSPRLAETASGSVVGGAAPRLRNAFLEKMKCPEAADVAEAIRAFVKNFSEHDAAAEYQQLPDPERDYTFVMEADDGNGVPVFDDDGRIRSNTGTSLTPVRGVSRGSSRIGLDSPGGAAAEPPQPPHDAVRAFLTRAEGLIQKHQLWRGVVGIPGDVSSGKGGAKAPAPSYRPDGGRGVLSETSERWEAVTDGLEKLVMSKLHPVVFGRQRDAAARDAFLSKRLAALSFVGFKHMEIPAPPPHLLPGWQLAASQLRAINQFTAPGDKLSCVMNACRAVSAVLGLAAEARGERGNGVGADDFLPGLILCLIRAAPAQLYSNVAYMTDFLRPSKLSGELGYFLTALQSAVAFLRHVSPDYVGMTVEQFTAAAYAANSLSMMELHHLATSVGGHEPADDRTYQLWVNGSLAVELPTMGESSATDSDQAALRGDAAELQEALAILEPVVAEVSSLAGKFNGRING